MPVGSAKQPLAAKDDAKPLPADGGRPAGEEAEILLAARSGDRAALSRLYERHAPMVHALLLARVGRAEAEDLVQEVFLRAISKMESLRDREAVGPWLASIARNLAADSGRRRGRSAALRLAAPEQAPPRPNTELDVDDVLSAIRELPEAYRETLMLRLVEHMQGPEIAERLGLTHGSVRVNLCRGMKILRERLGLDGAS